MKGYPDGKLSPANSVIKMSTVTAFFISYLFLWPIVLFSKVMISKGQSRSGWPLHKERTGKKEARGGTWVFFGWVF